MSFFLASAAFILCGISILHLLRLATGHLSVDVALGWFIGSGWFASVCAGLRFLAGISYTGTVAALVLATPVIAWLALLTSRRFSGAPDVRPPPASEPARWLPRPAWLFGPLAAYVLVASYATTVHGINTPTQTDDGVRVRAFTPILAFEDEWNAEARSLLPVAGTLTTWAPTLAWSVTGRVDLFHINYVVVTNLLALLLLVVGLGSSRGRPEWGWAGAFGVLSIPLFVHHCTTTYTDAALAICLGAGFVFFLEYERTRNRADAERALLLFVVAAFVKREGAVTAAVVAGPLLLQVVWSHRRSARVLGWFALLLLPLLVDVLTAIAAVGVAEAFPVLSLVLPGLSSSSETSAPVNQSREAIVAFLHALFRSGNQGMIYWILPVVIATRLVALLRARRAMTLLSVAGILALSATSSILLFPMFTIDGTTVHRALLAPSLLACLWGARTLCDWAREELPSGQAREPAPSPS